MDLSAAIADVLNKATAIDPNSCVPGSPKFPLCATIYGYAPSLAWNAFFLSMFAISALVHFAQGTYYRMWTFIIAMCLGGVCEVIGKSSSLTSEKQSSPFQSIIPFPSNKKDRQLQR